jgi:hypothetical protein
MMEVSAHAQNDNRSVAAEIFAIGTYFPNMPHTYIYKLSLSRVLSPYEQVSRLNVFLYFSFISFVRATFISFIFHYSLPVTGFVVGK